MASTKRSHIEIDPDYEDVSEQQNKRRRILEEGAKEATKFKIESIIKSQFEMEIESKEAETLKISEKLELARSMIDKLRACIVASYYANANQQKQSREQAPVIHPSVRRHIGKAPPGTPMIGDRSGVCVKQEPGDGVQPIKTEPMEVGSERIGQMTLQGSERVSAASPAPGFLEPSSAEQQPDTRTGRFKVRKRIIVGNVSKSIPAAERDENDQATHKWMVYVRGPKNAARIDGFVKKVWFFLHPSYRPNDLVEVSQPPFHLTRRGWGEFPVRVQLHFRDQRNKRLDIIHNLKLDRTYTGLQTLGSETVVDIEIERDIKEVKREKRTKDSDTHKGSTSSHSTAIQIKQEPIDPDDMPGSSDGSRLLDIKLEPIDHDYGQMAGTSAVSPSNKASHSNAHPKKDISTLNTTPVKQSNSGLVPAYVSPTQSMVHPSVLTTQAVTLMAVSNKTMHSQIATSSLGLSRTTGDLASSLSTVMQPASDKAAGDSDSPKKNIVLQCINSLTPTGVGKVKSQQNQTLSVPAGNLMMSGSQPILLTNTSGNSVVVQANALQPGSNVVQSNRVVANQIPNNPGLVFLKCTDIQGKTYLIPQPVCASAAQSPQKGGNFMTPGRVATPVSQPVFLNMCPVTTAARMVLNTAASPGKQKGQKSVTPGTITKTSEISSQSKQILQNGPIFFVKPDVNVTKASGMIQQRPVLLSHSTPVKSQQNANLQLIRNVATPQATSILNMKSPQHAVPLVGTQHAVPLVGTQQTGKGQLKVTSQGLIHVVGQASGSAGIKQDRPVCKTLVNGDFALPSLTSTPKQPIVFVPNNNKMTLIQGKGKSLLSPVSNLAVSQSNGNVIVLNQGTPVLANGNSIVSSTPATAGNKLIGLPIAKQSAMKASPGSSDMIVLQTKAKSVNSPANHVVIIPVTSENSVSMATKSHVTSSSSSGKATVTVSQASISTVKKLQNSKPSENSMLIVVQNDNKNTPTALSTATDKTDVSMSSLLASKSVASTVSMATKFSETQVTVSARNNKQKQIIVVNDGAGKAEPGPSTWQGSYQPEKKIITDAKKRKLMKEPREHSAVKETVSPLRLTDSCDMLSLIRASVQRHPLVSVDASRPLHPYCARSSKEWLAWNIGKRRASEWQRASCVRKFIVTSLDGETSFKGETVWTVKQILTWCRLHAYSPHYLEKPLHPTAIDLQAETSLPSEKRHRKFQSVTNSNAVLQEVTSLQEGHVVLDTSDDEVDVISEGASPTVKTKKKPAEPHDGDNVQHLPVSEGAHFVEEATKQIGVKLESTQVEPGFSGKPAQDMMFKCMERFMEDLLRETFALKVNMGRYPDAMGIADVFSALNNLSSADFITNKYLGVEETPGVPTSHR